MSDIILYDEEVKEAIKEYIKEKYNIWWADKIELKDIEINHYGVDGIYKPFIKINTEIKKHKVGDKNGN